MKNIKELITENYDAVVEAIKKAEESAYRHPECEYSAYIDTNGDADYEEWAAGSNGWYEFRDPEYNRFYIYTANHQYFDIMFDYWFFDAAEAAYAFKEEFGVDLDTDPVDEDGDEINESLYDNMIRQCKVSGIDSDRFDKWFEDQKELAIAQIVEDTLTGEIIDEYIRMNEELFC